MNNVNIVKVSTANKDYIFDTLYNNSALTMEGLDETLVYEYLNWIDEITPVKKNGNCYIIKGEQMNTFYNLTGDNSYPSDLTIIAIPLCDIEEPMKLTIPRFNIGARWFDDIVDNNLSREI